MFPCSKYDMKFSDDKYLEDHIKMKVLREVSKEMPNKILEEILKMLDKGYEKEFRKLIPPKKKSAFVTKF